MKRILYFDCFSGISGDMTLGALMDLGLDCEQVAAALSELHVSGYGLTAEKTQRHSIMGTNVTVHLDAQEQEQEDLHDHEHAHEHPHPHEHEHSHPHEHEHSHPHEHENPHAHEQDHPHARNLHQITHLISDSHLSAEVKQLSVAIFTEIAKAEAAVHGKTPEEVHFHEVGALDSIVDIVGTAICLTMLRVDEIYCSTVTEGHGFVECQHGLLPVPVPAVAKMMEGSLLSLHCSNTKGELVTPTGFGILKATVKECGMMPAMDVKQVGYGFGKRETGSLNALRVFLGTEKKQKSMDPIDSSAPTTPTTWQSDTVSVLECALDDESGEVIAYTLARLMEEGALDAYATALFMKKNRPGVLLTVLCHQAQEKKLASILFEETSTIGLRQYETQRFLLPRRETFVETKLGPVSVKESGSGKEKKKKPAYEDCARLAKKHGLPLHKIYELLE